MRKKLLAVILSLAMVFSLVTPVTVMADPIIADTDWYDAGQTEFTLTTPAQLMGFSSLLAGDNFSGKTVKLGADITLNDGNASDWASSAPANVWVGGAFAGTFDGGGNTISGVYVSKTNDTAGFFNSVTGTVKNVTFANSYFKYTGIFSGALAGGVTGSGKVSGVALASDVTVSLSGVASGGLIGYTTGTPEISGCNVAATISATGTQAMGGIVGRAVNGTTTVTGCTFSGSIITAAGSGTGGIFGDLANSAVVTVADCTVSGTVNSGTANYAGGIAGRTQGSSNLTVSNSRVSATITGQASTGGILGATESSVAPTLNDCVFAGSITGYSMIGGMVGRLNSSGVNMYRCISLLVGNSNLVTTYNNDTGMKGWFFGNAGGKAIVADNCMIVGEATCNVSSGTTTMKDANGAAVANAPASFRSWNISTATQLMNFRYIMDYYSFWQNTATLTADIDLNPGWTANAGGGSGTVVNDWSGTQTYLFNGTFNGGGHEIRGLYINNGTDYTGFLKQGVGSARVQNVTFANSYIRGRDFCGVVFGQVTAASAVSNVNVANDVFVSARNYVGGLIGFGFNAAPAISGCSVAANISCRGYTGGLVGRVRYASSFTVSSSSFSGNIEAIKDHIGGLIGDLDNGAAATFTNCTFTGTGHVSSSGAEGSGDGVGGALGAFNAETCSATVNGGTYSGSVEGIQYVGGVVGDANGNVTIIGANCTANVTSSGDYTGGVIGAIRGSHTATVTNTNVGGTVTGSGADVGGVIGNAAAASIVTGGTVSATVTGSGANVGGVIGNAAAASTVTGGTVSADVTGTNATGYVGGVIGYATAAPTIDGTAVSAIVSGAGYAAGGVIGGVSGVNATVENVNCTATVSNSSSYNVGGIIGGIWGAAIGTVSNTRFGGSVTSAAAGTPNMGGIVGSIVNSGKSQLSATDVLMDGVVNKETGNANIGGVVGGHGNGGTVSLTRVLVTGTVSAAGGNIGALIGNSQVLTGTLTDCYALSTSASNGRWQGNISNSAIDTTNTKATLLTQAELAGVNARTKASGLFANGGDDQWTSVVGDFPVLFSEAEDITAVYVSDISSYRVDSNGDGHYDADFSAIAPAGTIFAGWYTDEELTTTLAEDVTSGAAYAKFVDANVLKVRWQYNDDTQQLRIVTTVDSLLFQEAGFTLNYLNSSNEPKERTCPTTTVYGELTGWVKPGTTIRYTPGGLMDGVERVASKESTRFVGFLLSASPALRNAINESATGITATPYWVTEDGTIVTGTARDGLKFQQ